MSKFMVASRQAHKLEQMMVRLEAKIHDMEKESSCRVGESVKLKDEVKELKNLVKELKADVVKKDTCLDHLQKRSDELCTLFSETKEATFREFKASSEFTNLLDRNYAAGFEDFSLDAIEHFPGVDFNPIKLCTIVESSLLQMSSKDVNIKDDASTPQTVKDASKSGSIVPSGLSK